jgi:hypothetical protein
MYQAGGGVSFRAHLRRKSYLVTFQDCGQLVFKKSALGSAASDRER